MIYLMIFAGGGSGSLCRYLLGKLIETKSHGGFPFGTLVVNVSGCIIIGLLARYYLNMQAESMLRAALVVGFCGGFTTFSAFSYETTMLITSGKWLMASAYVVASVLGCLLATGIAMNAFWKTPA